MTKPVGSVFTFIVRLWHEVTDRPEGPPGEIRGTVTSVPEGDAVPFREVEGLGRVIEEQLERTETSAPCREE